MGDWSQLPVDLLEAISKKVNDIFDYVRFRAVCVSWCSAARLANLPPQLPWLMLPYDPDTKSRPFFSLLTKRVHTLELPEAHGRMICGSSSGWLVMVDNGLSVSLLNPLTRAQIQLPPITTLPGLPFVTISKVGEDYVYQTDFGDSGVLRSNRMRRFFRFYAFLSPNPSPGDNSIIISRFQDSSQFLFCRLGDDKWTIIETNLPDGLAALAYHEGKIYAVGCRGGVAVYDFGSCAKAQVVPSLEVPVTFHRQYLVVSSGDLLLVSNHKRFGCGEDPSHVDIWFDVLKLDSHGEPRWSKVESLGDTTLFLSDNHYSSLCGSDFSGCKANCIYFPAPYHNYYEINASEQQYMDVFDIEDGSHELLPFCWKKSGQDMPNPTWVTPSLY